MDAGYGNRMMLEMAPELTFGVLSPAFKGCEGNFALNEFSKNGCNFFKNSLCELFGTGVSRSNAASVIMTASVRGKSATWILRRTGILRQEVP